MRLLLADDHALFRDALMHYIERAEPDSAVMLARDLHEVMEIMESDPELDLILLDLRMPGMNGLEGLKKLKKAYNNVPIAMLSGLAEKQDVQDAMEIGAAGFFPKTLSGKVMMKGIHQILDGKQYVAIDHNTNDIMPSYYVDKDVNGKNCSGMSDNVQVLLDGADTSTLTPRETEVLSYLVSGLSNKEIANALDLQVVTVKLHVRGICRKLDAKNRTQAALKAQQLGITAAAL